MSVPAARGGPNVTIKLQRRSFKTAYQTELMVAKLQNIANNCPKRVFRAAAGGRS